MSLCILSPLWLTSLSFPTSSGSCSIRPVSAPSMLAAGWSCSGETPPDGTIHPVSGPSCTGRWAQWLSMSLEVLSSSAHHDPSCLLHAQMVLCSMLGNKASCCYLQNLYDILFQMKADPGIEPMSHVSCIGRWVILPLVPPGKPQSSYIKT